MVLGSSHLIMKKDIKMMILDNFVTPSVEVHNFVHPYRYLILPQSLLCTYNEFDQSELQDN